MIFVWGHFQWRIQDFYGTPFQIGGVNLLFGMNMKKIGLKGGAHVSRPPPRPLDPSLASYYKHSFIVSEQSH